MTSVLATRLVGESNRLKGYWINNYCLIKMSKKTGSTEVVEDLNPRSHRMYLSSCKAGTVGEGCKDRQPRKFHVPSHFDVLQLTIIRCVACLWVEHEMLNLIQFET